MVWPKILCSRMREAAGQSDLRGQPAGEGSLQSGDRRLCGARWHLTGVTRMGTDMQEMVDVAFSQRDGLRDWHGLEMDAPERMPAGGMAKAWHNDMPFIQAVYRGTGC